MTEKTSFFRQPVSVWATAFAAMVGFMSLSLVDPILTSIARGLNAGPAEVSLLFTSYFAVTSVMMLITGFVSTRIGGRATLLLGAALIAVFRLRLARMDRRVGRRFRRAHGHQQHGLHRDRVEGFTSAARGGPPPAITSYAGSPASSRPTRHR